MAQDKRGVELKPGDVVGVLFEVTNIVSDSERLNLLVRHVGKHHGLPDDWRLQLSGDQVELVRSAPFDEPAAAAAAIAAPDPSQSPEPSQQELPPD